MGLEPQPIETRGRTRTTGSEQHRAAVHVADHVARQHPHPLDDTMPKLAGRLTARNPAARAQLLELLDALGLTEHTPGGTR
jgi:hypothetical protein